MNVSPKDLVITVAAGTGEVSTKTALGAADGVVHGLLMLVGIKAPNAIATYDLTVYDSEGYILYAGTGLEGALSTISTEKLCNSFLRLVLTNCTHDGAYSARLYVKN